MEQKPHYFEDDMLDSEMNIAPKTDGYYDSGIDKWFTYVSLVMYMFIIACNIDVITLGC